jgi:subtilase family serine protease
MTLCLGRFRSGARSVQAVVVRGLLVSLTLGLGAGAWGCKDKKTNPVLSADLMITTGSPTPTPSTVAPGVAVTLSAWTVKNQGTATSANFSNGFYLSTDAVITTADTYLDGNSNTGLAAGDSFAWIAPSPVVPLATAPGSYYVGILVDRTNVVAESNESNNYVSTAITVEIPGPDLTITTGSPTPTPSTVAPGGTVILSAWTVTNQGTVASGGFSNGFYLSTDAVITSADTYLDGNSNSTLVGGASFAWGGPTLTIPGGTAPGTYYVGVLVDPTDAVTEFSESNNYVSTLITVGP